MALKLVSPPLPGVANIATSLAIGGATIGSNALAVTGSATVSGDVVSSGGAFIGGLQTTGPSGGGNSNFSAATGTASTTTTAAELQIGGATTTGYRSFLNGATATTLTANASYAKFLMSSAGITEAASGTHPLLANLAIKAPAFTNGAGATAIAATTYIEGAPTGVTGTTGNYALYSAAGLNYFGGEIQIGNTVNVVSPTSPNRTVTMVINGTTYYLAAKTTND